MPDGSNVVLARSESGTVVKPKPQWVPPKTQKEARNRLTQELLIALRDRPHDFAVIERRFGSILLLRDDRTGMSWRVYGTGTQLTSVRGCGCSGLRVGWRNGFKIERAVKAWDAMKHPDANAPPEVHEAKRLWLANNPNVS